MEDQEEPAEEEAREEGRRRAYYGRLAAKGCVWEQQTLQVLEPHKQRR